MTREQFGWTIAYVAALVLAGFTGALLQSRVAEDTYNAVLEQRRAQTEVLQRSVDSLRREAAKRDTVYRTKWRTRWDTVVATIQPETPRESTLVAVADSTIGACTLALNSCTRLSYTQDSVIRAQRIEIKVLEKKPGPCRLLGVRCEVVTGVLGFAGGLLVGQGGR